MCLAISGLSYDQDLKYNTKVRSSSPCNTRVFLDSFLFLIHRSHKMSNPPPIDPPEPITEPVRTYTATMLPENWKARDKDQKLVWLDTQPLPMDQKVSLGALYRCGYNLNVHFHFLYDVLKEFRLSFSTLSVDNVCRKLLNALIDAFNAGIVSYGNALWTDIEHLLEDGTWGNQLPALEVDFFEQTKGSTEEYHRRGCL